MKKLKRYLAIPFGSVLVFLALFWGCLEGPEGDEGSPGPPGPPGPGLKGSLEGIVTLFGEEDSSGITVKLLNTDRSLKTDASGHFLFKHLKQGTYALEASLAPYQPKRLDDLVISGHGRVNLTPFSLKAVRRLNGLDGDLKTLSPDGTRFFFLSCYNQNVNCYLYSQASDGSSEPVLIDMDVYRDTFQLTPDGSKVVYLRNWGLYTSPADRSEPRMIDAYIYSSPIQISADSSRVVYRKSRVYSSSILSSASLAGGSSVDIDIDVYSFQVTQDSAKILYNKKGNNLYVTPIDQSAPVLIDSNVVSYKSTPDNLKVVYFTYNNDLKTSRLEMGVPVLIDISVSSARILPDSATLLYLKGTELYSSPLETSAPLLIDRGISISSPYNSSPDGKRAIYWKDMNLYTSPINMSAPVLIDLNVQSYRITKDSSRFLYLTNKNELFTSPIDRSEPLYIDSNVGSFIWTSDNSLTVYMKRNSELCVSPVLTPNPVILDSWVNSNPYRITPDDSRVLYYKGKTLYFRAIDASRKPRAVDDGIKNMNMPEFTIVAPDGKFLIYSRLQVDDPESQEDGIFRLDFPQGW